MVKTKDKKRMPPTGKRKGKTSSEQYLMMIHYMQEHTHLCYGKLDSTYTVKDRHREWANLAKMMNACSTGERRTIVQWRKVWSDWKAAVKIKAAKATDISVELNPVEQRLVRLFGDTWYERMEGVHKSTPSITTFPSIQEEQERCHPFSASEESESDDSSRQSAQQLPSMSPSTTTSPHQQQQPPSTPMQEAVSSLLECQKAVVAATQIIAEALQGIQGKLTDLNKLVRENNARAYRHNLEMSRMTSIMGDIVQGLIEAQGD